MLSLSRGNKDGALPFLRYCHHHFNSKICIRFGLSKSITLLNFPFLYSLRLALDKDPEYVRALTVMGQTLLHKGQEVEAVDYFERAVAKVWVSSSKALLLYK